MAFTESQLLADAAQIKNEVVPDANSALRVGTMLEDIIRAGTKPYDPDATYAAGQYVFFGDAAWRCLSAAAVGESPALVAAKWRVQIQVDIDQLTLNNANMHTPVPENAGSDPSAPENNFGGLWSAIHKGGGRFVLRWSTLAGVTWRLLREMLPDQVAFLVDRLGITLDTILKKGGEVTGQNIVFDDYGNVIFNQDLASLKVRGVYLRVIDGAKQTFRDFFGWDQDGNWIVGTYGAIRTKISQAEYLISHLNIRLSGTVTADAIRYTNPEGSDGSPDGVWVAKRKSNGLWYPQFYDMDSYENYMFNRPRFRALLGSGAGLTILQDEIECFDESIGDPTYDGPYTVTAATLGKPQPHLLNLPGAQILPRLSRSDGQPETALTVSFPTSTTLSG